MLFQITFDFICNLMAFILPDIGNYDNVSQFQLTLLLYQMGKNLREGFNIFLLKEGIQRE